MSVHGVWSNRFIISAIIQGAIITGLTISIVSIQILFSSKINIIQFLSLSFEGPAKWFFLGYIFYMILVVAIAVTATFYHHLEIDMRKEYSWRRCCHNTNYDICWTNRFWDIFSHYKRTWCFFFWFSVTTKYWSHGTIYSTYICVCGLT
jgi:hypothetical protein